MTVICVLLGAVGLKYGLKGNELPILMPRKGDGIRRRADCVPADAVLKVWEVAVQCPPGGVQALSLLSC